MRLAVAGGAVSAAPMFAARTGARDGAGISWSRRHGENITGGMVRKVICRLFHREIYWPLNGKYACVRCGTKWPAFQPRKEERRRQVFLALPDCETPSSPTPVTTTGPSHVCHAPAGSFASPVEETIRSRFGSNEGLTHNGDTGEDRRAARDASDQARRGHR
jgi:hypothetical protein